MQEQTADRTQRLENAAEALPGIKRVRVDTSGERLSVRVLVAPERTDDEATRMVRDLARNRLGIEFADDAIEILRTSIAPRGPNGPRRRLMSLTTERLENRFVVRVVLELAGDLIMGHSEGPAKKQVDQQRLVAEAVVNALGEVLDLSPTVESVEAVRDEGAELWVVTLDSEAGTMVGAARLRQSEHDAAARATLDALNRAMELQRHTSP